MRSLLLAGTVLLGATVSVAEESNVNANHKFAWGENIGWTNWLHERPEPFDGVIIEGDFMTGYIWGENVGWINAGDGTPADGRRYSNRDDTDFGVNIKGNGNLVGLGWGENIGWVNFDTSEALGADAARFDSCSRRLRGYAWGENVGWINLDDEAHFVGLNEPRCIQIKELKVKCSRRGTLKVILTSFLTEGTAIHAVDNADNAEFCMIISARGKGKFKRRDQTGTHEICLIECPLCKQADCP